MFIENNVLNLLYQINTIRSFLIAVSIARHGDLATVCYIKRLLIPLIWYKTVSVLMLIERCLSKRRLFLKLTPMGRAKRNPTFPLIPVDAVS